MRPEPAEQSLREAIENAESGRTATRRSGRVVRRRGGTPFLPPVTENIRLDMIATRTFGSRVIYERYRRARDESD